jgi:hypothetical protein
MYMTTVWIVSVVIYMFFIDVKLAQHDELPRQEKKSHWSKTKPIRESKNEKHHYRGQ